MTAKLSRREQQIVDLLAEGETVQTIAEDLGVSPHTVRNHLKASFRKYGVSTQVQLVVAVLRERGFALDAHGHDVVFDEVMKVKRAVDRLLTMLERGLAKAAVENVQDVEPNNDPASPSDYPFADAGDTQEMHEVAHG